MGDSTYIHGTTSEEQRRLTRLNAITNPAFLAFLELGGDERVLEIGSGLGLLAAEVAERVPHGEVVGVERLPEQLAACPEGIGNLRFVCGDARRLPPDLGEFDIVYCRYLLEHVDDPAAVLRETRRVLRSGGRFLVQENDIAVVRNHPDTPAFGEVWRRFAGVQSRLGGDAYVGRRLLPLLSEAGFRDVRLSIAPELHHHGTPNYAAWLENLIDNLRGATDQLRIEGVRLEDVHAAVAELQRLIDNPRGATTFYWDRATAVR